jgi:hypothetical protein
MAWLRSGGAWVAVALVLLAAGPARGESPPAGEQASPAPPGADAEPARPPTWVKQFNRAVKLWPVIAAVAAGLVVLTLAARAFIRGRATTDPERLAASDPWVQAQLRESDLRDG